MRRKEIKILVLWFGGLIGRLRIKTNSSAMGVGTGIELFNIRDAFKIKRVNFGTFKHSFVFCSYSLGNFETKVI